MSKAFVVVSLLVAVLAAVSPAFAQGSASNRAMSPEDEKLRDDVRRGLEYLETPEAAEELAPMPGVQTSPREAAAADDDWWQWSLLALVGGFVVYRLVIKLARKSTGESGEPFA